jgi:hypothetical protein
MHYFTSTPVFQSAYRYYRGTLNSIKISPLRGYENSRVIFPGTVRLALRDSHVTSSPLVKGVPEGRGIEGAIVLSGYFSWDCGAPLRDSPVTHRVTPSCIPPRSHPVSGTQFLGSHIQGFCI